MSVVFGCGFARVTVKESFHKPGSVAKETDPDQRWKNYRRLLDESAKAKLAVDRTLYRKKSRTIYDLFRTMSPEKRSEYLQYFSLQNWKALPESQKSEHAMSNCDACQVHHFAMQSFFRTVPSWSHKSWFKMFSLKMQARQTAKVKPTQKDIKSAVKHIYSQIDAPFQKVFKVSFAEAQTKVSELELQKKKNKIEKKKRTSTTRTPRKTKAWKRMVRTRHRNDVSDEAVVQSAGQTEKVSLLRDYGGSCYKGRETEEAGRSWWKKEKTSFSATKPGQLWQGKPPARSKKYERWREGKLIFCLVYRRVISRKEY